MATLSKPADDNQPWIARRRAAAHDLLTQAQALVRLETAGRPLPDPAEMITQDREDRQAHADPAG